MIAKPIPKYLVKLQTEQDNQQNYFLHLTIALLQHNKITIESKGLG